MQENLTIDLLLLYNFLREPNTLLQIPKDCLVFKKCNYKQHLKINRLKYRTAKYFFIHQEDKAFAIKPLLTLQCGEPTPSQHQPADKELILHQLHNIAKEQDDEQKLAHNMS